MELTGTSLNTFGKEPRAKAAEELALLSEGEAVVGVLSAYSTDQ